MRKILLTIQYNGSAFSGWQKQKNALSVQQVLEEKISSLLKEPINLHASGRTDAGVHAFCQTAHFETNSVFDIAKLPKAINSGLNPNVSVLLAKEVPINFHARFCVKKKTYLYRTYASDIKLPLLENGFARINKNVLINLDAVKTAASHLIGTHNFKAFCASGATVTSFERTIFDIKIKKNKNIIDFYFTGNGFLYNMVRILTGTLIAVGEGKIKPEEIPLIIKRQERKYAGKTMPANALYLYKVKY